MRADDERGKDKWLLVDEMELTFFPLKHHRVSDLKMLGFFRRGSQEPNSGFFCFETCDRWKILFILHLTFATMMPKCSVLWQMVIFSCYAVRTINDIISTSLKN